MRLRAISGTHRWIIWEADRSSRELSIIEQLSNAGVSNSRSDTVTGY